MVSRCRIVVEYFDQAFMEGEIQRLSKEKAKKLVHAEMHELLTGKKRGRENDHEITLFDSVGISLEDYSVLRLVYELSEKYTIGEEIEIIPEVKNPKDLFGVLA